MLIHMSAKRAVHVCDSYSLFQVWDFNTGNPLPIAVDQLCTASCVSKDGYKVVMAMTDKFGGGTTIKVLDLLSNRVLTELTYPDTIGMYHILTLA